MTVRMLLPRRSALVRGVTLVLLLWAVLDSGAHGLFASDLGPLAPPAASARHSTLEQASGGQNSDHCFCHSLSLGATVPAPVIRPDEAVAFTLSAGCESPHSASRPLFHPPQALA